ncbi:MAG: hypothetical protein ACR2ME_10220 [Acidimicrobiia bacterium]
MIEAATAIADGDFSRRVIMFGAIVGLVAALVGIVIFFLLLSGF